MSSKFFILVGVMVAVIGGGWIYSNETNGHRAKVHALSAQERAEFLPMLTSAEFSTSGGLTFLVGHVERDTWDALPKKERKAAARQLRNSIEGTKVTAARVFKGRSIAIAVRGRRYEYH